MNLPERRGGVPDRRSGVPWGWVAVGAVAAVAAVLLIQVVLSIVFGLVRSAAVVVVLAVIAWLVIVGPPDFGRKK